MTGQIREVADWALAEDIDPVRSYDLVTALLVPVGYRPARDGLDHWRTLLAYLADFERWGEAGPDADEAGLTEDTWLRMIRDELIAVAGRPT
jgi:hypothetical protein